MSYVTGGVPFAGDYYAGLKVDLLLDHAVDDKEITQLVTLPIDAAALVLKDDKFPLQAASLLAAVSVGQAVLEGIECCP